MVFRVNTFYSRKTKLTQTKLGNCISFAFIDVIKMPKTRDLLSHPKGKQEGSETREVLSQLQGRVAQTVLISVDQEVRTQTRAMDGCEGLPVLPHL